MKRYGSSVSILILAAATATTLLISCTFKKPTTDAPVSSVERSTGLGPEGIPKSFFVDPTGKPKKFICGQAALSEMTEFSQATVMHGAPMWDHCNLEFVITETNLIAKLVNPSFPNDRSRWKIAMMIPISKHYYYEKDRDANGRELNKFIENDGRSHWSARPYIKLELDRITFGSGEMNATSIFGAAQVAAVEDVEWDLEKGFLGFSLTSVAARKMGYQSIDEQVKTRVNFLRFDHNPKFAKMPFNDKNYRRMNVLHITGEKVDGVWPILYAARWDLSRTHDIYLVGFPEEFKPIAKEVVKQWNTTLQKIKAVPAGFETFVVKEDKEIKYGFDLRYSTMTWIADQKISRAEASPLGVAMVTADVINGEVLWGGITLWGGYIVDYIKGNSSNSVSADTASSVKNLATFITKNSDQFELSLPEKSALKFTPPGATEIQNIIRQAAPDINLRTDKYKQQASGIKSMQRFLNLARIKSADMPPATQRQKDQLQLTQSLKELAETQSHSFTMCADRKIGDVSMGWRQGMVSERRDLQDATRSVVKELIIHEYGHFLGLGHQFKENILPAKGSVPDAIYESLKSKAEKNFTNMTSVMGYRHPTVEIATPYEEIVPGPQDELVLQYLYNGKYATFKPGDADFTFFPIPANGIIPEGPSEHPELKTSYFPQCNDFDATVSSDPFCNRFDRGYNATTLVDGYIKSLTGNLAQSLFAYTDARGVNHEMHENSLWARSLQTFGRLRLFYDYMRYYYANQFEKIRRDEKALYDFSNACKLESVEQIANETLRSVFRESPGFRELCKANGKVMEQIEKLVSLDASDYTRLNMDAAFSPGGISAGDAERDNSRWLGSWNELSAMPLKISALYALSAPSPWVMFPGYGLVDIPHYDRPDFRFGVSTLYPKEHTQIITAAAKKNLFFSRSSIGESNYTIMGNTVNALSYFNWLSRRNNDAKKLPENFNNNLRNQTQFNLKFVALLVTTEKDGNMKKRLSGSIYDLTSGQTSPLTEVYLLPGDKVIARGEGMFIYPLPYSSLRWVSDTMAYTYAYQVDYTRTLAEADPLTGLSIKRELQGLNNKLLKSCLTGTGGENEKQNGLATYFTQNTPTFSGFRVDTGIALDDEKQTNFKTSVNLEFKKYESITKADPQVCAEALNGLGIVVSTAAILNGMWIPEVDKYLEQ